jgi:hypothetical protein
MAYNPHSTRLGDFPVWLRNGTGAAAPVAPPVAIPRAARPIPVALSGSSSGGSGSRPGRRARYRRAVSEEGVGVSRSQLHQPTRTAQHDSLRSGEPASSAKPRQQTDIRSFHPLLRTLPKEGAAFPHGRGSTSADLRSPPPPTTSRRRRRDVERVEHANAAATYLLARPDLVAMYGMEEHRLGGQPLELHVLECALAGRALRPGCRAHCPAYPGAITLPANVFVGDGDGEGCHSSGEEDGDSVILVH